MATPLRVLYVFTARKGDLLARAARGEAPDTLLFGYNHMDRLGVRAEVHEPRYSRAGQAVARQVGRLGPDALQLRTLPRFTRYDAVFLTGGWPLLLAARAIPRTRRPRLVWLNMTLTNLLRRPGPTTPLLRAAVAGADRVVCVSRHQQAFLQRLYGWPAERVPLALSGTDASFYARERAGGRPPDGPAEVLAAGRDAGRDYATLLRAAGGRQGVRLVCSPANLTGLTLPDGATARFNVPEGALRNEYAAARCVAVPTAGDESTAGSDGSGTLVLLDALAMGKPAVVSRRASVADYVTAGEAALTVPPGDVQALRGALESLLDGSGLGARLGAAGQERVHAALTTRHFAERIAGTFREVR